METISYDDFKKLDLRVAKIVAAERVEKSDKLLRLTVTVVESETRTIVAGVGKMYEPGTLVGRLIIILANLEPKSLMGTESHGMLLAADSPDGPIILVPEKSVEPGAQVK
jgi:methionine--tRNA ligase beta chain